MRKLGKITYTEKVLLLMTAVFLLSLLVVYLLPPEGVGHGYEITTQLQQDADPGEKPLNVNTATEVELDAVDGIGPVLAGRIVEYRQEHGPFRKMEDLLAVDGIGEKRKKALLKHFKSMKNMREASVDQLREVLPEKQAELLWTRLHEKEEA